MVKNHKEICVPGFMANGIPVGIKENGKSDLALIFSEVPAKAAAVFTTNLFKAAPVILDIERVQGGMAQAIIINSGNANASTGKRGYDDAVAMSKAVARGLGIPEGLVLVASTGIIGERLPIDKILGGTKELIDGLSVDGIPRAEEGIMTTDRFPKVACRKCTIGKKEITVCGIAKGAGMIEPNMATMLSFIMTDVAIEGNCLDKVFKKAVDKSFNAISVDGCMSTNDSVIALANGVAGNRTLEGPSRGLTAFRAALDDVMGTLAQSIVQDGEGATKLIEVVVEEARTRSDAKKIAYAIANSNLVKTAFFGEDPNWGRIISAVGSAGVTAAPESVELYVDTIPLFRRGMGIRVDREELLRIMKKDRITVTIRLDMGKKSYRVYTADLTYDYVKINAQYHT